MPILASPKYLFFVSVSLRLKKTARWETTRNFFWQVPFCSFLPLHVKPRQKRSWEKKKEEMSPLRVPKETRIVLKKKGGGRNRQKCHFFLPSSPKMDFFPLLLSPFCFATGRRKERRRIAKIFGDDFCVSPPQVPPTPSHPKKSGHISFSNFAAKLFS